MHGVIRRQVAAPADIDGEHGFSGSAGGSSTVRVVAVRLLYCLPPASGGGWLGLGLGRIIRVHRRAVSLRSSAGVGICRSPTVRSDRARRYGTIGPSGGGNVQSFGQGTFHVTGTPTRGVDIGREVRERTLLFR